MTSPSQQMNRILQIHPFLKSEGFLPGAEGQAQLSIRLSHELASRGQKVGIFPYPEWLADENCQVLNTGSMLQILPTTVFPSLPAASWLSWKALSFPVADKSLRNIRMVMKFLAGLHQAVQKFKPDIIHNHASFSDFPLLYQALGLTIPLILSHHSPTAGRFLDAYRMVVFSTEALRSMACATDPSLYDRSRLIRPAVERVFADSTIPIKGNRKGILFVGSLRLDTRLQILLRAYAKSAALRRIPLRICGIGPEEKSIREYVRRKKIPVTFLGKLPPEQVCREMLASELLVNPSPAEGFKLAMAEAMCCGTPVLGWNPQLEELHALLRMECGAGFDPALDGPEVLAEKILDLRTRRTLVSITGRKKLAAKARAFFSIERFTTEYMCLYDDCVDGHA